MKVTFALLALVATAFAAPLSLEQPQADTACVICEWVLNETAANFPKNLTKDAFKTDLKAICGDLPSNVQPECDGLVALFSDKIYEALDGETPADQVCSEIKLCSNSTILAPKPVEVKAPEAETACVICEWVLNETAANFPKNLTKDQFKADLKTICGDLPSTVQPECNGLVALFSDKIYDALDGGTPAAEVCAEIKLCSNSTILAAKPVEVKAPEADTACVICEWVLNETAANFPKNLTKDAFKADLKAICGDLPSTVQPECDGLVALFSDKIYEALDGEVPADQVCSEIKLCSNSTILAPEPVEVKAPEQPQADTACVICEWVLNETAANFPKNLTKDAFKTDLKAICGDFPSTVQPECDGLVALFSDKIYEALDGETPSDQVCSEIKLCSNSTVVAKHPSAAPVKLYAEEY